MCIPAAERFLHCSFISAWVDGIVEGTVIRSGGSLRVTAQLIQASTDTHLWAEEYQRDLTDLLKLESDVARAIGQQIRAEITPEETRQLSLSSAAALD
jgi:adenylate cyclase